MPRPPLGKAARTKIISVRVTEDEAQELTRRYGKPSRALRILVSNDLKKDSK